MENDAYERAKEAARKSPELVKAFDRARVKTNLLYTLLMVASDLTVDVNEDLKLINFKLVAGCTKQLKKAIRHEEVVKDVLKRMCTVMWSDMDTSEQVELYEDVTRIKELMVLVVSKCCTDSERFDSIINMISKRYKSKLDLDKDEFVD